MINSFNSDYDVSGNNPINGITGSGIFIGGNKVLGARITGWTAAGGAAPEVKAAYNPAASYTVSASYTQAELQTIATAVVANSTRIKALESALRTHGLIN